MALSGRTRSGPDPEASGLGVSGGKSCSRGEVTGLRTTQPCPWGKELACLGLAFLLC